jgi:hypothetical protein
MSQLYRYVVEGAALEFLVAREDVDFRLLIGACKWLACYPHTKGVAMHRDAAGHRLEAHLYGAYTLVTWVDHAVCEVRVVEILVD